SFVLIFFFSSRRRHTRWPRDWSSDVCSSDLGQRSNALDDLGAGPRSDKGAPLGGHLATEPDLRNESAGRRPQLSPSDRNQRRREIGRASCRERVESTGGGGSLDTEAAWSRQR